MTKKNHTKRALISSAISLFLCFSMLVGTTFAWFTDSVSSARNTIVAGNLDVVLEYWNGEKYAEVTGETKLFDDTALWEPGHTEVAYLKVSNAGTLALKYQLSVNFENEVIGKTKTGADIKLSEHLVFSVVEKQIVSKDDEYTRETAVKAAGESQGIKNYESGTKPLEKQGDADYVALIIYMPESVDNEANHDGINIPSIQLGVNLVATQLDAEFEKDSFGPDYDAGAYLTNVHTTDELASALEQGASIKLGGNIDLGETTLTVPEDKAAVIDLAGYNLAGGNIVNNGSLTIKGSKKNARTLSTTDAAAAEVPAVVYATIKNNGNLIIEGGSYNSAIENGEKGVATIRFAEITTELHKSVASSVKNYGAMTIENTTISSIANNGGSAIYNEGELTVNNSVLNGAPNADGSWPSYTVNNTGIMTATNVKITSYHGAVASYGEGALVTLNNCEIDMAGIPGFTSHGIYTSDNGSVIVNGGTYANKATDQAASGASVINGAVTIIDGTFSGRIENYYGTPVIKGGTFSVNPNAKFLAEGFKAYEENGSFNVRFPQESFDKLIDDAQAGDTLEVPAGEYVFPAGKIEEGMTLNCAAGTVFKGQSKLNINGATVIGATFSNPGGTAADQTINGTFKDCTFTGANGLRWCYAGDTVVFENCVFNGSVYGIHFDGGANDILFKNCTISGFNAIGGEVEATFEGCTFKDGNSNYNGINLWGSADIVDCTFVFDGKAGYEWVDLCGDNTTVSFTNCVVTDGTNTKKGMETVVGNYGKGNTIIINGETVGLVSDAAVLDDALNNATTPDSEVILTGSLSFNASATTANSGYGATGVSVKGGTLDGNGYSLGINNWGTWDSAVHTTGGTIKNLTINSGMRGIFMGSATADVYIDNVTIDGTIYTFNSDGGSKEYGVYISNSTLNGWTSFSDVHKEVIFTNCDFGEGNGYAFCRPYNAASFVGCDFEAGYEIEAIGAVTFENCTIGGVALTAENLATLVVGGIANATVK